MSEQRPRLNRYLASCGIGSRRGCEEIVRSGRVCVNRDICTDLATRIGPEDSVTVDGRQAAPESETTILLNKPAGYLCTRSDTGNRPTIYDLIPPHLHHLHHVGRLDMDSEGLLLMTNSGEITEKLTHPRHKIEKEYFLVLAHPFDSALSARLIEGIPTEEGFAKAAKVHIVSRKRLCITLRQGLKRQIHLMFSALKNKVVTLDRIRIGELTDDALERGRWRTLGKRDLDLLWKGL